MKKAHVIVNIAVMGWNLALLPEEERDQEIQSLNITKGIEIDDSSNKVFRELISSFVERKLEYFDEFDIFISDFKLEESNDEIRLSVVSLV
ncbi:hypothetical protein A5482_009740 [Cyanobacterium sp. IPPAS B-1200]|uniref:hypothetical protein n=1 Tax=Cyanobacterium sp. IPPAS B-1200 TaxID=1562720 RepID=UPI0008526B6D|nr:hypothetical protein [Cyanobacterium sp. IPPAS B-1200]OEJ80161.1 hypothetical protein A5482_06765 [Cyanobacterium sp. IPPAS B-1200]